MATQSGELDSDLAMLEVLRKEPFKFGFFEAVRLFQQMLPGRKPVGQFYKPASETLRFTGNPSFSFPASEVQELNLDDDPDVPAKMKVNFLGLSAPTGILPTPYTELILERAQRKDHVLRDFLDLFNHRIISLFYRAWEKHHFFVSFELRTRDSVSPIILSLLGMGTKGLEQRQGVPDRAFIFYAGLLAQKPRCAQNLKQLLEDYFEVDVEVEQFIGKWIPLGETDQTALDESQSSAERLGFGAVVGDEVWDQQSTVRVKLGPLTLDQYLGFLPREESTAYADLKALLKFWANDQLDFEVQLILKRDDTPELHFDSHTASEPLLGWTTWVKNRPMDRDPSEAIFYI